jgi:uncharacterized membrane protein
MKKTIFIIISLIFFIFFFVKLSPVRAQEPEILEGVITQVLKEEKQKIQGQDQLYQEFEVLILNGSLRDQEINLEMGNIPVVNQVKYKKGDEVLISYSQDPAGNKVFYITDFVRKKSLFWLFAIFIATILLITGIQGIGSLIGMAISFFIIFKFVLPQILLGKDPVFITLAASLMIIPLTFYFSHGLNKKTTIAVFSTFIALLITGILAKIFVDATRLTGFVAEETSFLTMFFQDRINIKALLLSGIIISVLGVLDDITVSQAAIVKELKEGRASQPFLKTYKKAMNIGKDHISSMVNTLVLVYTGAALPLLLIFINNPHPFSEVINYEIVAEEIVRALVSSIGLITAVPITTFLAVLFI